MLTELAVRDLGVIADLTLVIGPGMTAITGETGAGKTLVVEALELVVGGRADTTLVRPGANEASVAGRFAQGEDDVVLSRVVPASGRSRGYVNGRPATVAELDELGRGLVDLHGQHAHQSLLSGPVQRGALDAFAGIDLAPLREARARVRSLDEELAGLGGDPQTRARELDLLRYQLAEIDAAAITDPDEDARLEAEEDTLADAAAHREAAVSAHHALSGDGGAADAIGTAIAALTGRAPLAGVESRLRAAAAELADAAGDLRGLADALEDDPERLAAVRARRQLLRELQRKYGETLVEVVAYGDELRERATELERHDERAAAIASQREAALADVRAASSAVAAKRRKAAPKLAAAIEEHLQTLAMPRARFVVEVDGEDPGDDVRFLIAANPGDPPLPLAKVASGGELARTMLAARLVLIHGAGASTLVFDEVDAGVGGEAAVAVGRALADLARRQQVLVVTHLPQVAAFADAQVAVAKHEGDGRTVVTAEVLDDGSRVVELSRMLSGQPSSETAQHHAKELLAVARARRG